MKVAWKAPYSCRRAACTGVALGAIVVLAGCCTAARRPALATEESRTARPANTDRSPAQDSPATTVTETRSAPVLQAEVRSWNGKPLIVVETEVPGPRWRAVLAPLPVADQGAREFRLVLVPPARGQDGAAAPVEEKNAPTRYTVLASESFPPSVEQIVIYGTDDALVIPTA